MNGDDLETRVPAPESSSRTGVEDFPRVAVLVTDYPVLSETFVRAQVEFLRASVFTVSGYRAGPDAAVESWPILPSSLSAAHRFFQRARGWVLGRLPFYFTIAPTQRAIIRRLAVERPEVILIQFGFLAAQLLPAIATLGIPIVVHFHGSDNYLLKSSARYRKLIRRIGRHVDKSVVVNTLMVKNLVACGYDRARVALIPYGVNPVTSLAQPQPNVPKIRVLFVGRLVPFKDPLGLLEVFRRAREALSWAKNGKGTGLVDLHLTVIGGGALMPQVQARVNQLGIGGCVELKGAMPHDQALASFAAADVYVHMGQRLDNQQQEGWPVSVAEAAASSLPIISTLTGGIDTIVLHDRTGYLVEPGDYVAAAEHLVTLALDADLRQNLGRAGKAHVDENFARAKQLNELLTVLSSAADPYPQPSQPR